MNRELLQQTLRALEDLGMRHYELTGELLYTELFTTITEALAQPEQKPQMIGRITDNIKDMVLRQEVMLYTDEYLPIGAPVYTTPPQRKPLTDEEIGAILEDINAFGTRLYTFARAIEAAHGIKGQA